MSLRLHELIINGYMRCNFRMFTPDIVIHILIMYFSDIHNISCNVYDKELKLISDDNIINVYLNGSTYFYISKNNILYVDGDNSGNKSIVSPIKHSFFNGSNSISIMSRGMYNNCIFAYTNGDKLFKMGKGYSSEFENIKRGL